MDIYNDYGISVKQTTDGGYILIGLYKALPDSIDASNIYIVKADEWF